MKKIWVMFAMVFCLCIIFSGKRTVLAINTGFEIEEFENKEKEKILNNINISLLINEPKKDAIECFDVNEAGFIAIGSSDDRTKRIVIYDNEMEFQYGYEFETSGVYYVEWDEDDLLIYFVRSSIVASLNQAGEVKEVLKIKDYINNTNYWYDSVYLTEKFVGNKEYKLKNDMGLLNFFSTNYSQIEVVGEDGKSNIIYDVNTEHYIKKIFILICSILFFGAAVFIIGKQALKGIRKNGTQL